MNETQQNTVVKLRRSRAWTFYFNFNLVQRALVLEDYAPS